MDYDREGCREIRELELLKLGDTSSEVLEGLIVKIRREGNHELFRSSLVELNRHLKSMYKQIIELTGERANYKERIYRFIGLCYPRVDGLNYFMGIEKGIMEVGEVKKEMGIGAVGILQQFSKLNIKPVEFMYRALGNYRVNQYTGRREEEIEIKVDGIFSRVSHVYPGLTNNYHYEFQCLNKEGLKIEDRFIFISAPHYFSLIEKWTGISVGSVVDYL